MAIKLIYDHLKYELDLPFNGIMIINSDPFYMEYEIKNPLKEYLDHFESAIVKKRATEKNTSRSDLPLRCIDGLLMENMENSFKIEIAKGQIYLMDKRLEEYFK